MKTIIAALIAIVVSYRSVKQKNWHDLPKWEQFYRQCTSAKEADALAECYADDARLWAHATDGQLRERHRHPDICELMYGK